MTPPTTRRRPSRDKDDGQITVFLVALAPAVVMFAGLIVDGGGALADKVEALGVAQEAARAGAQALDLSAYRADSTVRLLPDQADTAARRYLAETGSTGTVTATADTVTVVVTVAHDTQLLGILGVDSLSVTASGTARPVPPPEGAGP